jgi:hypothetical protein
MKTVVLPILLCVSLAVNAALLVRRSSRASEPARSTTPPTATINKADDSTGSLVPPEVWDAVKAGDPSGVERLRALGIPERILRSIVRQQIAALYREREKALYPDPSELKYWKSDYGFARFTPKDRLALLDLRREQKDLLRKLLGPNADDDEIIRDTRFASLPPGKSDAVRQIEEDYQAMIQKVRGEPNGVLLAGDREKIEYLQKEKRKELEQTLTPAELTEYDLRNSPTSFRLRWELAGFNPTEQEFRDIYKIQSTVVADPDYNSGPPSREQMDARRSAQAQADAQIKALLGDQRYAEYQRGKDYDYQKLAQITNRLELPPEKAVEAYNLKNVYQEKVAHLKVEPGPNFVARMNEARANLAREAEASFTQVLGPKGYQVYQQSGSSLTYLFRPVQGSTSTD